MHSAPFNIKRPFCLLSLHEESSDSARCAQSLERLMHWSLLAERAGTITEMKVLAGRRWTSVAHIKRRKEAGHATAESSAF